MRPMYDEITRRLIDLHNVVPDGLQPLVGWLTLAALVVWFAAFAYYAWLEYKKYDE